MPSVDDRVVRMEFDNAAFEKKLQTTLTSIENLNKSLQFKGATKGLGDVSAAASKFNMNAVSAGIENVSKKFLALSTIAITALSNITNRAVSAGISVAKSLTLEPVMAGFREYETKMGSIQTILANTARYGTTLAEVNKYLDELNQYADKTIYSFGDMTKNIGLFTNAGINIKDATAMIKGFSNEAAASGTNAEQAANAAYQLSQGLSSGIIRLMDWRSLTNAGMGNKNMQRGLVEIADAMGTLNKNGVTAAGVQKNFNESLQKGWLTSDVMTNYLRIMAGEMSATEMASLGLTKTQIAGLQKQAKTAEEAATKVRTFTQLMNTVKEAIGSGWAETFQLIFGNFTEATSLFTGINDVVGGFVGKMSDARNELLKTWKNLGGREILIWGIANAFHNLGLILEPIKKAFREIFPRTTAKDLLAFSKSVVAFSNALKPSKETLNELGRIFKGFFAVLSIGWTIIKETVKFFVGLGRAILGLTGGGMLDFMATIGDFFTSLQAALVKGGGIADFFKKLSVWAQAPIPYLEKIRDAVASFFNTLDPAVPEGVGKAMERFGNRVDTAKDAVQGSMDIWDPFENALMRIWDVLDKVLDGIGDWFHELGKKIADQMDEGDFDAVLDALNVALLGGIAALIAKFLKGGINLDVGKGLFEKIGNSFDQLTGVLKAMQTQIKAEALQKIAISIGILTASVLVLSMIDSAALTKALTAMAVGFGQLLAAFAAIEKIGSGRGAVKFGTIAVGMIALSSAILILSAATAVLAKLDWEELARGLTGVTVLLTAITIASKPLAAGAPGLIRAGVGVTAIAIALGVLAVAMKIFATMSWEEMAKGLVGVGGGLTAIGLALKVMPKPADIKGIGLNLIFIAGSMVILSVAMKQFAEMNWADIGKGLATVGGALLVIGLAMKKMPKILPSTAAGLVLVSGSLILIAQAMTMMGQNDWVQIGKGLATLAGSLLILGVAMKYMELSVAGAAALLVIASSLIILAEAVEKFGNLDFDTLINGLKGMAIAIGALAIIAYAVHAATGFIFSLGIALAVVGGAFAAFGIGAYLVVKALEAFIRLGPTAGKAVNDMMAALGASLPAFFASIAEGFVEIAVIIGKAAPVLAKALYATLWHLIDTVILLIPKIAQAFGSFIDEGIKLLYSKTPALVAVGFFMLIELLKGFRDNIGEVTKLVAEIVIEFLDSLAEQLPAMVESVVNFFVTLIEEVSYGIGEMIPRLMYGIAFNFMAGFVAGLEQCAPGPMNWFKQLPGKIIGWIGNIARTLWNKGVEIIQGFISGYISVVGNISSWFASLPGKIVGWIGNIARTLWNKGIDIIQGFINGYISMVGNISSWFASLPGKIVTWVGDMARRLWQKGIDLIGGFLNGIYEKIVDVITWFLGLPGMIVGWIPNPLDILLQVGKNLIEGLWNGILAMKDWFLDKLSWLADQIPDWIAKPLGIRSPSTVFAKIGTYIVEGLGIGITDASGIAKNAMTDLSNQITDGFQPDAATIKTVFQEIVDQLGDLDGFNPTITPVLDLTEVQAGAARIGSYINAAGVLSPGYSYRQANTIAYDANRNANSISENSPGGPTEVKFEQIINAPTQLSTSEIYKQTRNQITIAKEELKIS